jgi:hypothetical protein
MRERVVEHRIVEASLMVDARQPQERVRSARSLEYRLSPHTEEHATRRRHALE